MSNSTDTFIKLEKKVVGETTRRRLKIFRHQCIPTNKQWWFRRIVSKKSASNPFTVFTMAMVKVCILSSVSLCIQGSRTKWIGAALNTELKSPPFWDSLDMFLFLLGKSVVHHYLYKLFFQRFCSSIYSLATLTRF